MPSANQYLTLPPPWKGLCNKGPSWSRPPDTCQIGTKNWLCSQGTDYKLTTRMGFGQKSWWGSATPVELPVRPVNYVGDFSDQNSGGAVANYCVTYQSGGVPGAVMIWDGAAWVALAGPGIVNVSALVRTHITFDLAGTDYVLYCDGVGTPIKINLLAGTYAAFASAPEVYKACMVVADRLVVGNLATSGAEWVDCSSAINFEAGWNINMVKLADTTGPIVAMRSMGATMGVIYKSDAIYLCIPQTGPAPFRYELRASGIKGPTNEQDIVVLPDNTHVWIGVDGQVYRFDGTSVTPSCPLVDKPLEYVTPYQLAGIQAVYWKERGECWFFYPMYQSGDCWANGGALVVTYPDMAAFQMEWPYNDGFIAFGTFTGDHWQFNPYLVGFGHDWVGIAGIVYVRAQKLVFATGTLNKVTGGVVDWTRHYLMVSRVSWPHGMGISADGDGVSGGGEIKWSQGISCPLRWQDMILADNALVTPLQTDWLTAPAVGAGTEWGETMTPSATLRRWGVNENLIGQTFNGENFTTQKQCGFPVKAGESFALKLDGPPQMWYALPGPTGLYSRIELHGVRLAFYAGTPGRR
jgi:hypothetical protein